MTEKTENNTINLTTNERTQQEITISGNPGKPIGEDGEKMLRRMNESHYAVTGWALEHWKIRGNDRILDIGCGGGATLKRMSEEVRDGHLTGVDYSATSLELSGKTNAEALQQGKMDLVEASVENCLLRTMLLTRSLRWKALFLAGSRGESERSLPGN